MKLGSIVQINIGVTDLAHSLNFYKTLGYQKLDQNTKPYPWAQLTDGQNLLLLNQDGNRYLGLGYFSADAAERVAAMEKMGIEFVQKQEQNGRLFMAIFSGPGRLAVGLINHDPTEMPQPTGEPLSICGKFGEFSINVDHFQEAADFWTKLGFDCTYQSKQPYPWGIFTDSMIVLGIHQTPNEEEYRFDGPAITYFSPDMADRIANLKEKGISFAKEIADDSGLVSNAIIAGPDGEELFLFNGEI